MIVEFTVDGNSREEENLTLVEQTKKNLHIENEQQDYTEKFASGKIRRVEECYSIGITQFDKEEIEDLIPSEYFTDPIENSAIIGDVRLAEQNGDMVYIEFSDGLQVSVHGELDRAYTY